MLFSVLRKLAFSIAERSSFLDRRRHPFLGEQQRIAARLPPAVP